MTARRTTSAFAGFRFPPDVISVAVRWYLRYGLSYRDVEVLLAERGVIVDHVSVYRWVQRFTPEFIEAARPCRRAPCDRWFVDETYLKVAGTWTYLCRAVDQNGQVIDVLLSARRDLAAAWRFFTQALRVGTVPVEVSTDRAPVYPQVLDELIPSVLHIIEQYANNPIEVNHGRLKARLRPMRGVKRHRSARILAAGHHHPRPDQRPPMVYTICLVPAPCVACFPQRCPRATSAAALRHPPVTQPGHGTGMETAYLCALRAVGTRSEPRTS